MAEPPPAPVEWGRPWLVARGALDNPIDPALAVELFPTEAWSAGAGFRIDRLASQFTLSAHWWPRLPRTGRRAHQLLLGIGGDVALSGGALSGGFAASLIPSIDVRYVARLDPRFGFVFGLRTGAGALFDLRDLDGGRAGSPLSSHLGVLLSAYAGFCFGAHRQR